MVYLQAAPHLPRNLELWVGFRFCVLWWLPLWSSFTIYELSFGSLLLFRLFSFGENGDLLRQLSRAPTQPGLLCTGPMTPAGALSPMCGHLPSLSICSCLLKLRAVRAPALRFLCSSPSLLPIPTTIRQTVPRQPNFRRPSFQFFFWDSSFGFFKGGPSFLRFCVPDGLFV